MSERRKRRGASSKTIAYIGAGLVHVVIIGAMLFNFTNKTKTVEAFDAETIDVVKERSNNSVTRLNRKI